MKRNFVLFFSVLFLTVSVLGCNMLRGAGQDVENAGASIQKTVDHNDQGGQNEIWNAALKILD